MGLALEFLAALIAGRQALSLHSDGIIVVDGQERVGGKFRVYLGSLLPAHRQLVGILKSNRRCPPAPTVRCAGA